MVIKTLNTLYNRLFLMVIFQILAIVSDFFENFFVILRLFILWGFGAIGRKFLTNLGYIKLALMCSLFFANIFILHHSFANSLETKQNLSYVLELDTIPDSNYLMEHQAIYDPFEKLNRKILFFNNTLEKMLFVPVIKIYNFAIPEWGRDRVDSFSDNIATPVYFFNNILQGDVYGSFVSFWRFAVNSSLGIGGLFDIASIIGLKNKKSDFGATLAKYNINHGPYLVLPILGPSSLRDFVGISAEYLVNPINYRIDHRKLSYKYKNPIIATNFVSSYSKYYEAIDEILASSLDPYVTLRSFYMQIRAAKKLEKKN